MFVRFCFFFPSLHSTEMEGRIYGMIGGHIDVFSEPQSIERTGKV